MLEPIDTRKLPENVPATSLTEIRKQQHTRYLQKRVDAINIPLQRFSQTNLQFPMIKPEDFPEYERNTVNFELLTALENTLNTLATAFEELENYQDDVVQLLNKSINLSDSRQKVLSILEKMHYYVGNIGAFNYVDRFNAYKELVTIVQQTQYYFARPEVLEISSDARVVTVAIPDEVIIDIEALEKGKERLPTNAQASSNGWPILSHFFRASKSNADEDTPLLKNAKQQAIKSERAQLLIDQGDAEQENNSFILTKLLRKFRKEAQQAHSDKKQLPDELLLQVLSFLSPKDLTIVAQVCRELNALADDVSLWKIHARRDFPFFQQQINAAPGSRLKYQYRNQLIRDSKIFNARAELQEMMQSLEAQYQDKINAGLYSAIACLAIAGVAGGVWVYQKEWGNNSLAKNVSPYIAAICLAAVVLIGIVTIVRLLNEALSTYGKNKEIDQRNRSVLRYNAKVVEEFGETLSGNVLRH